MADARLTAADYRLLRSSGFSPLLPPTILRRVPGGTTNVRAVARGPWAACPPLPSSSGMTLVEVLLTLCLLVLLASITWPALDRPMADHRLRKAADAVRVEWSRARVKAMSSGATQVFRYAPDSDRYAIESQAGPEYAANTDDASTGLLDASEPTAVLQYAERTLPEHITFVGGETTEDTRSEMLATDTQNLSATESGWSDPIAFYPDGTTSTATVVLKNEHDRTIELFLRGVTGIATVGNVKSGGECLP